MAVDEQSYAESGGWTSPNTAASRRKLWEAMLAQGLQGGPIGHWTQGAGRLAKAMIGGYGAYKADEDEREGWRELGATLGAALPHPNLHSAGKPGTDTPAVPAPAEPSAAAPPSASMSAPAVTGTSEPGTYPGVRPGTPFTDRWRAFLDDLRARGVTVDPTQSGGYANRNIRGTNTPSLHASDQAYDVNWRANPEGSVQDQADIARQHLERDMGGSTEPITQIHPMIARELAERHGMRWGGDFTGRSPDPMHFEVAGGVPMAQRAFTARAGLPPPMRLGGPTEAETAAADPAAASVSAPPGGGTPGGDWDYATQPGRPAPGFLERLGFRPGRFTGAWSDNERGVDRPEFSGWRGNRPPPNAPTAATMDQGGAPSAGIEPPVPGSSDPRMGDPAAGPAPGAPPPATSVNAPLGTPSAVPGVTMGSAASPMPPGAPPLPAPTAAAAPAAQPAAAAQTMPATDVIRRLLQSRNPQAIQFGLQLYRDMARRGPTADYDFQAVEGTLYRVNKRTGQAEPVSGTGQPRPPEAIRTQAIKADQAYRNLTSALDDYERLVTRTGITALPGADRDAVTQSRTNIMLQLKELYNLGVLNGPDYELMQSMIPGTDLSTGNVLANPSGRVGPAVARLREMLRTIRNNQTSAVGMPPIQGGSDGFSIRRVD